ncbi:MAG: prenyltransferase [Candidatus Nomurabacteria bacterium]|nr:prenyltransferase [Candidatus Nomurabacteria bacterium]
MLRRIWIYLKEMFPLFSRLLVGLGIFFELYFIVLLNYGVTNFSIGIAEFVGAFTVFAFLFLLRVADDFKDYQTDKELFPERALPSGKVRKSDLIIALIFVESIVVILNLLLMNNWPFLVFLYLYGGLMSFWFFAKSKIQKNLPLALITHNPVQIIINIYVVSFTCIKYGLDWQSITVVFAVLTMYFPGLIWEISRKIRAPRDETKYTTYSKIFGYKKSTNFVLIMTLLDIVTNIVLVWNLNKITIGLLLINLAWMIWKFVQFKKDPTKFKLVDKVVIYTYIQESLMILTVAIFLLFGRI